VPSPAKPKTKRKAKAPPRRGPRIPPLRRVGSCVVKFGPEVRSLIVAALKRGATQKLAAEYAGVDPRTVKGWLAKGRENLAAIEEWDRSGLDTLEPALDAFGQFVLEVGQARAAADFELVGCISDAARAGEWRAAASLLARRRPAEFGDHLAVSAVSGPDEDGERRDVTGDLLERLTVAARRVRGERDEPEGEGGEGAASR
jgi:hypothetical protein